MALIGAITWARCTLLSAVQIAAAIAAAYMVKGLFSGELHVETVLGAGTSPAQGVIIEMLLTAQLAFAVFMMAAEKHQGTFLAPLGLGFSLFITELVGMLCNHCQILCRSDSWKVSSGLVARSTPLDLSHHASSIALSPHITGYTGLDQLLAHS